MNKNRLLALAAFLRKPEIKADPGLYYSTAKGVGEMPVHFSMDSNMYYDWKTQRFEACIAGHAVIMSGAKEYTDMNKIGDWLGLSDKQRYHLFTPAHISSKNWDSITAERAAEVVEHLAETGEVVW